jgi:hypothetical protein
MTVARVLRSTGILAALALACLPATTVAQGARVPVIAGQNPGCDACGSHETMDCGVGTPWHRPGAYTGPCRSGWVFRKYVGDFAG